MLWIFPATFILIMLMLILTVKEGLFSDERKFAPKLKPGKYRAFVDPGVEYEFSHPNLSTFSGPIIAGWPPFKSRNASHYFHQGSILSDLNVLDLNEDLKVLMILQSAPQNVNRRNAIRETWKNNDFKRLKIIFLFGTTFIDDGDMFDLTEELRLNRDFVQFDFIDTYANVTLDSLAALKFVDENKGLNLDFLILGIEH